MSHSSSMSSILGGLESPRNFFFFKQGIHGWVWSHFFLRPLSVSTALRCHSSHKLETESGVLSENKMSHQPSAFHKPACPVSPV